MKGTRKSFGRNLSGYGFSAIILLFSVFLFQGCSTGDSNSAAYMSQTQSAEYTVTGRISNPDKSQYLADVTCTLSSYSATPSLVSLIQSASTDSSGRFTFTHIPAGRYSITAARSGYITSTSIFTLENDMTIDKFLIHPDEWSDHYGTGKPYDPDDRYITSWVLEKGAANSSAGISGVSVTLSANDRGKGTLPYTDDGYMNTNGAIDWDATSTYSTGMAAFYEVLQSSAYTVTARKGGVTIASVNDVTSTPGVITSCIISTRSASSGMPLELVNDSDYEDSEVYVIITGNDGAMEPIVTGNIPVVDLNKARANHSTFKAVSSKPLSTLTASGTTITQTGRSRNVYPLTITQISGGVLWVSYSKAITFADNGKTVPSPGSDEKVRYDKFEFTYKPSDNKIFADTTSIDFFGIPIKLERIDGTTKKVTDSRTVYVSTRKIMSAANALSSDMSAVFLGTDGNKYSFDSSDSTEPHSSFARILSGKSLASALGHKGLPAPYTSMQKYLKKLYEAQARIYANGTNYGGTYDYSGVLSSDGKGGYDIVMSGTMTGMSGIHVSTGLNMTLHLPASGHTAATKLDDPEQSTMDNFIMGAPSSHYAFTVADISTNDITTDADGNYIYTTAAATNFDNIVSSPYINIYGDVMVSLMSGYVNGRYPINSDGNWFMHQGNLATRYPFAGARPSPDDGLYYQWAALVYNLSDAYGHPYSDRGGRPNPTITVPPVDILRATFMADNRLDAPTVTATATDSTIDLKWDTVEGAASYTVTVTPPYPAWTKTITAGGITLTADSASDSGAALALTAGTPYTISVQALKGDSCSAVIPVHTATTGTLTPLNVAASDPDYLYWQQGLNVATVKSGYTFTLNGASIKPPSGVVFINGKAGLNRYVLTVSDATGPVFQSNYVVQLNKTTAPEASPYYTPTGHELWFLTDPVYFFLERSSGTNGGLLANIPMYNAGTEAKPDLRPYPIPPPFSWPTVSVTASGTTQPITTLLNLGSTLEAMPDKSINTVYMPKN